MTEEAAGPKDVVPPIRGVGRNILVLLGSQVTTWVLGLALLVAAPRLLGPTAIGELRIAQSLWAIFAVFITFGTAALQTVTVARQRVQARPLEAAVTRVRVALFLVSVPIVMAISLIAGYEATVLTVVLIYAAFTLFNAVANSARSSLYGLEAMGDVARVDVVGEVVRTVVILAVLSLVAGPVAFAIATSAVSLAIAVLTRRLLFRATAPIDLAPAYHGWGLLKASRPYLFADAMGVVYLQMDTIIISLIATETEVGWYSTADALFSSLLFVPTVLLSAIFPRMARAHETSPQALRDQTQQAFSTFLLFGIWIGLGALVTADTVVTTVFGSEYDGAGPVLGAFGVVTILAYLTILLGQYAVATDRARYVGYMLLLSSIISVPIDIVLVRWTRDQYDNGAIGAALAFVFTEGLQLLLGIVLLAPFLLNRHSAARVVKCAIAGLVMMAATWPLRTRSIFLTVPLASLVYLVAVLLLRTPNAFERDAMRSVWRKVRARLPGAPPPSLAG